MSAVLHLTDVTISYGQRRILAGFSLSIGPHEVFGLMGPGGVGKSTLLHSISGRNRSNPMVRVEGDIRYCGSALGEGNFPLLLVQRPSLMGSSVFDYCVSNLPNRSSLRQLQQREVIGAHLEHSGLGDLADKLDEDVLMLEPDQRVCVSIARLTLANPALLCLDEPTARLQNDEAVENVLRLIALQRKERSVLLTTHNQSHAKTVCDGVGLLAGGRIVESGPKDVFFGFPQSQPAREFVRCGSCSVPSPDARPEELDSSCLYSDLEVEANWTQLYEQTKAEAQEMSNSSSPILSGSGPRGFQWVIPHRLAGTPMPGIVVDTEDDLFALQRVGVSTLLTLTESPLPEDSLSPFGLRAFHHPIIDMQAPSLEQAKEICLAIDGLLMSGAVVAVHCKAGKGRTGTVLAAYLIWHGSTALEALKRVRRLDHTWVQAPEQEQFLSEFEANLQSSIHCPPFSIPSNDRRVHN